MKALLSIFLGVFFAILFVSALVGCDGPPPKSRLDAKPFVYEKPFVIIDKCNGCEYVYTLQDKNGNTKNFDDDWNKYSIGDTIK